jgi:phosphohistidine phosphatase
MQVIILRHAHAEWPSYSGADFDRPLTARGLAEARSSARAISDAGHRPAFILASPACRTRQTAEIVAEEFQLGPESLLYVDSLYNASSRTLADELRAAMKPGGTALLVAHNPGVSDLVRDLGHQPATQPLRTAEWRVLPLD